MRHDHTVTWLAYWKDTISAKDFKYVFLGATSTFKADSDLAKYEKVRLAGRCWSACVAAAGCHGRKLGEGRRGLRWPQQKWGTAAGELNGP